MKLAKEIFEEPEVANSFLIETFDELTVSVLTYSRLRYHQILLFERGTGPLTIDNNTFEISDHCVFLMSKGQVLTFHSIRDTDGYKVSFGDCFWEKAPQSASNCKAVLFNNTNANHQLQLSPTEFGELSFLFRALHAEYGASNYINQQDALAAYLKIIMIKLANVRLTEEATFDSQDYMLYRNFMELLSSRYRSHHAVSEYATMLNITTRRLSELCKRCSGLGAKELINGQIIAEAKRRLQFSSATIKQIAYELHFNSPEQFSHFFKNNVTQSPAEFRLRAVGIGA
ncbi:MAG: helix-turn-helix transcriptional regulator [Sphingobacterium sp.]|jgi:AraC-like DNA-binding protein|uniref:AraC family transcriptional regulator n=1 Tax=Sphingobacterium sp. TaxID=341027 RepID=UPI00284A37B0|nr:helix-turn-helix transcriptional regulator [Sphingobacterium sp.]MDR3007148.1 helix-turn-helix transcriptional regulator [Sphingobacterium sp.]